MNIYELAVDKFKDFNGSKLILFESGNSKVWMEANKDFDIFVYALRNGKMLKDRWQIGSMVCGYEEDNILCHYRLVKRTTLERTYQEWVKKCKS